MSDPAKASVLHPLKLATASVAIAASVACSSSEPQAPVASPSARCEQVLDVVERRLNDASAIESVFAGRNEADSRINLLERSCSPGPRRELAKAQLLALDGRFEGAQSLLAARSFSEPGFERIRLFQLYLHFLGGEQREEMLAAAAQMEASFPESPEHRLIRGMETCYAGRCTEAIADLEYAAVQIRSPHAYRMLLVAYAYSGRTQDATRILDSGVVTVDSINDGMLLAGVGAYLNAGRPADAESLVNEYVRLHPEAAKEETGLVARSRQLLEDSR